MRQLYRNDELALRTILVELSVQVIAYFWRPETVVGRIIETAVSLLTSPLPGS